MQMPLSKWAIRSKKAIFNPITATKSGKIEDILVEDAQPVEFGEVLFIIA